MAKKQMKIEDLAVMVKRGFDDVDKQFRAVYARFDGVDKRFNDIDKRLERIEKILIADHHRRIERLEIQVKDLRDMFAIK